MGRFYNYSVDDKNYLTSVTVSSGKEKCLGVAIRNNDFFFLVVL